VYSYTYWLRPRNSPLPPHLGSYTRALLVSQERRHLFSNPLAVNHGYLISTAQSRRTKRTSINKTKKDPYSLLGVLDPDRSGHYHFAGSGPVFILTKCTNVKKNYTFRFSEKRHCTYFVQNAENFDTKKRKRKIKKM
jgi:hypothetical protein